MITNIENIVGNYIMIFPLQMGVAGAAISTLVSRLTGAVIMLVLLKKEENPIHIKKYLHFEWSNSLVSKILAVGLPSGMENGIFQLGKILVLERNCGQFCWFYDGLCLYDSRCCDWFSLSYSGRTMYGSR